MRCWSPVLLWILLAGGATTACVPAEAPQLGLVVPVGAPPADGTSSPDGGSTADAGDGGLDSDDGVGGDGPESDDGASADGADDSGDGLDDGDGQDSPDTPLFDVLRGYDSGGGQDLGGQFNPETWQELPDWPPDSNMGAKDVAGEADGSSTPDSSQPLDIPTDLGSDLGSPDSSVAPDVPADTKPPPDALSDISGPDAGGTDAPFVDQTVQDLPVLDVPPADALDADAGKADLGGPDATEVDAGVADTVIADTVAPDTGGVDGGSVDSGIADSGAVDSSPLDSALLDSAGPDSVPADTIVQDSIAQDTLILDAAGADAPKADTGPQDVDITFDSIVPEPCPAQGCDDGEPCTSDSCSAAGTCVHVTADEDSACKDGMCHAGICSRNAPEDAGMSCKSLLIDNPTGKSGVWWLDADGPFGLQAPYPVWCDMMAEGGGWTMLLKVGAENSQLGYDAPAWSNIIPLHPDRPRLDAQEAKLDSYWSLPFTELRVGLSAGKQTAWLVMPVTAASLHQIIVQGTYLPSNISLTKWLGLLPGSVLQPSCNLQGFNVAPGKPGKYDFARVRIGVVANLEGNCDSPDSRLGIGGAGTTCAQSGGISSGNAAGCLGSGAAVNLPAVGYVFAR